jgi:hypothetical protein
LFWPLVWRGDSFNKYWGMQSTSKGRWPFCSYQLHIWIYKVLLICNAGVFLILLPNNTKATATSPVTSQLPWAHTTYPSWQTNYTTSNPIFAEPPSWGENKRDSTARANRSRRRRINNSGSKSIPYTWFNNISGSESTISAMDDFWSDKKSTWQTTALVLVSQSKA